MSQEFVRDKIAQGCFRDALAAIRRHRDGGHYLVLMSASVDFYVPEFGRQLGFDQVISTEVRWDGDRLDGTLTSPNRRGKEKARCLRGLLDERPDKDNYAYGNSASDLPHMRLVQARPAGEWQPRRAAFGGPVRHCLRRLELDCTLRRSVIRITFIVPCRRCRGATPAPHLTPITQVFPGRHYDADWSRPQSPKMPITRGKFGVSEHRYARSRGSRFALLCALPAAATPPLAVQRYSLEEGLSQQAVNAITQDADGFMWFGTEDGLNRFDGYEFRQLRHDRANEQLTAQRLDLLAGRERRRFVDRDRRRRRVLPQRADRQALDARAAAQRGRPAARARAGARQPGPNLDCLARSRRRHLRSAQR